ncbi:peptidoglycan-binding protein [Bhargavaea massiliensis]
MYAVDSVGRVTYPSNFTNNLWSGQTLKRGDKNDYVKTLQSWLYKAGFNPEGIDGVYGANTEKAVKEFQKKAGIAADGIAGKQTYQALQKYVRTETTASQSNSSNTNDHWTGQTLREGSYGQAVKDLQLMLKYVGYSVSVDGVYGSETEKYVKDFQKSVGLQADGIAGKNTYNALNNKVELIKSQKNTYKNPRLQIINKEIDIKNVADAVHYITLGPLNAKLEQFLDLKMEIKFDRSMRVTQNGKTIKFTTPLGDTLQLDVSNLLKAKLNNTALYERNYADTIQYGNTGFESKYFVLLDALKPNSLQPDGYYLMSSSTHSLMQDIDFSDFLGLKTKKGFENLKITLKMELTQNYKVKKEYYDSMATVFAAAASTGKIAEKWVEKFVDFMIKNIKNPKAIF